MALLGAALLAAALQLFGGPSQSYQILRRVVVFAWNLGPQVEFKVLHVLLTDLARVLSITTWSVLVSELLGGEPDMPRDTNLGYTCHEFFTGLMVTDHTLLRAGI